MKIAATPSTISGGLAEATSSCPFILMFVGATGENHSSPFYHRKRKQATRDSASPRLRAEMLKSVTAMTRHVACKFIACNLLTTSMDEVFPKPRLRLPHMNHSHVAFHIAPGNAVVAGRAITIYLC